MWQLKVISYFNIFKNIICSLSQYMRLKTVLIVSRVTCDLIVHFALKESKLGMSGGLIYRPDFDVISIIGWKICVGVIGFFWCHLIAFIILIK